MHRKFVISMRDSFIDPSSITGGACRKAGNRRANQGSVDLKHHTDRIAEAQKRLATWLSFAEIGERLGG